jgi:hypothetical protein
LNHQIIRLTVWIRLGRSQPLNGNIFFQKLVGGHWTALHSKIKAGIIRGDPYLGMRNFVTVIALMVSMAGIFVSLAREELRCKLGLSAESCHPSAEKLKELPKHPIDFSDFTKPASQILNDKPESIEQGSLEKSDSQPITSPNLDKISNESDLDSKATKILKPVPENSDKLIIPSAELGTSNPGSTPPDSVSPELNPPAHESNQMDNNDSAASANDSLPVENSNDNPSQPIPVIPPPQVN